MENLHMRLIIEKKLKREIKILNILKDNTNSISAKELADELNASEKTVVSDIEEIKKKIPLEWNIIFKKNVGYTITISDEFGFANFIKELIEESPLFVIVSSLFNNELFSIEEWEERLYMTESTLKRALGVLRGVLQEFKLKLALNPIDISGNEVNIRYFFFQFFYSSDKTPHLQRPTAKEILFYDQLKITIGEGGAFNQLQYYRSLYWIMIIHRRVRSKHVANLDDNLIKSVQSQTNYNYLSRTMEVFSTIFDLELSIDDFVFLYLIRWDALILDTSEKFIYIDGFNSLIEKKIKLLVLEKVPDFRIDTNAYPFIFNYFEVYFNHLLIMCQMSSLFQKNSDETNYFIKNRHFAIFEKWIDILNNNIEIFSSISDLCLEDIAVQLTMLTFPHVQKEKTKPTHILFLFDASLTNLLYLNSLAERFILNNVRVTVLSNKKIENSLIEKIDADIIVSNNLLTVLGRNVYLISSIPTAREWDNISNLVLNLNDIGN
ncbi:helix-turn-helix domain-containing protein [Carnobacterium maltaromaticum]|uniref:helix-turn-helix domain-containing protein n=1 Tax=Carnobacterium maltaromaticum TaxID=2751 RepID=UPI00165A967F|nr:helix-turn-helix domain containing protein [Carnobacterium maltaromaticum]MBC9810215.1 HTH domain-containing protein [Carnobacterium maltaromaticum]